MGKSTSCSHTGARFSFQHLRGHPHPSVTSVLEDLTLSPDLMDSGHIHGAYTQQTKHSCTINKHLKIKLPL